MIYIKYTYSILKFYVISNYFINTQVKYLYNTFTLKKIPCVNYKNIWLTSKRLAN